MAEPQQTLLIKIDNRYDASQRPIIGDEIVEFIKDRTRRGLSKDNKPFKVYSASYVKSLDFKVAGKSKDQVNLELSGDMLIGLSVLSHGPGFIKIGFDTQSDNDKAAWNAEKGREFLGIMPADLNRILENYPISEQQVQTVSLAGSIASEFLRSLFK